MPSSLPMTEKGRANLEAQLKELEARSPGLVEALRQAREKGDLSENAEFDAAKEAIASLEASINEVTGKLNRGQIVDIRKAPRGKVAFGATVKVLDLDTEKEETYTLCGYGEEDTGESWILTTSPLAQGLMLRKVGDEPEVKVPRGTVRYRILEITYPE
jgi:transcription elongation factor GreA